MFDITIILEFILVVIAGVVCRYLIPWLKEKRLEWLVTIATQAAEQTITNSDDKKNYVIEWLQARGITYDASKIDAIIEACVYKINNETKDDSIVIVTEEDVTTEEVINEAEVETEAETVVAEEETVTETAEEETTATEEVTEESTDNNNESEY